MLLKSLISLCIKSYLQDDETGFNEDSISSFLENPNYKGALNNIINAINRAIARLYDTHKIMFHSHDLSLSNGILDTTQIHIEDNKVLSDIIGEVISFIGISGTENLPIKVQQIDTYKYVIDSKYTNVIRVFYYGKAPILKFDPTGVVVDDREADLSKFGITDSMCHYITNYVKGEMLDAEGDTNAANFKNLFEDFISTLQDREPIILQANKVYNVCKW